MAAPDPRQAPRQPRRRHEPRADRRAQLVELGTVAAVVELAVAHSGPVATVAVRHAGGGRGGVEGMAQGTRGLAGRRFRLLGVQTGFALEVTVSGAALTARLERFAHHCLY